MKTTGGFRLRPYKHVCLWVNEWVSVETNFQDWSDSHYSVLIGCCLFKFKPSKGSLHVEQSERDDRNPKRSPQAVSHHTGVVMLCCDWDSDLTWKETIRSFCLKSHHIVTRQETYSGASCLLLPRTDAVTAAGAARSVGADGGGFFSTHKFSLF